MSDECVILVRHPSGKVIAVMDDESEQIAVFKDRDEAIDCALNRQPLCKAGFPYQIVECDEL